MDATLKTIESIKTTKQALELLSSYIPLNPIINKAIDLAIDSHKDQYRKSGEPYVVHPILVACIVAKVTEDEAMVVSALLHDVVEDTPITIEEIQRDFGDDVSLLVDGMTKIV
ncbi:MAG: HD domain-containing protein, partial [Thiovulaceae bacterium]|nr:HD domain-containing protein [Sulfurimonadaceae bacterium]